MSSPLRKEDESMKYYDFVSLYPTVNKFDRMPVGHPRVLTNSEYEHGRFFGLVKAKVLPPRRLYHPVLPMRSGEKLIFPLCRTCTETKEQGWCRHNNRQRCITGTWCTPELDLAIEMGYTVVET